MVPGPEVKLLKGDAARCGSAEVVQLGHHLQTCRVAGRLPPVAMSVIAVGIPVEGNCCWPSVLVFLRVVRRGWSGRELAPGELRRSAHAYASAPLV